MDAEWNRPYNWYKPNPMPQKAYVCGYCGHGVSSSAGFPASANGMIYLCSHCSFPTFFGKPPKGGGEMRIPGSLPGREVPNLPADIVPLYLEARQSASVGAYTACVLICRKMLVNLAVSQGDEYKGGRRFAEYVEYLTAKVFSPEYRATWLDRIREEGNKATHELGVMGQDQAMLLIEFIEMLLKVLFEYPNAAPSTASKPAKPTVRMPVSPRPAGLPSSNR